jgi:hypothetical protein
MRSCTAASAAFACRRVDAAADRPSVSHFCDSSIYSTEAQTIRLVPLLMSKSRVSFGQEMDSHSCILCVAVPTCQAQYSLSNCLSRMSMLRMRLRQFVEATIPHSSTSERRSHHHFGFVDER